MRALTIQQPFAELIAQGVKRVENRTWRTRYRGPLVIHAGRGRDWLARADAEDIARAGDDLALGVVVAVAELVACVEIGELFTVGTLLGEDWSRHEYAHGPWCWLLANVRRLAEPIPAAGRQSLWTIPSALANQIAAQVDIPLED